MVYIFKTLFTSARIQHFDNDIPQIPPRCRDGIPIGSRIALQRNGIRPGYSDVCGSDSSSRDAKEK